MNTCRCNCSPFGPEEAKMAEEIQEQVSRIFEELSSEDTRELEKKLKKLTEMIIQEAWKGF